MTRLSTLPNGLRIVSRAMPHVETVAVALHIDAGARHEGVGVNGVAHLFEHMVFKGTASRSARAIAEQIEDVGGSINAYTARDMTVFHARLLAADLPLGVEVIADLVTNPLFDADETEREKQVVLQELGEARDTPDDIVWDHLQEAAFAGQPLGRSILGSEASIAVARSRTRCGPGWADSIGPAAASWSRRARSSMMRWSRWPGAGSAAFPRARALRPRLRRLPAARSTTGASSSRRT